MNLSQFITVVNDVQFMSLQIACSWNFKITNFEYTICQARKYCNLRTTIYIK